MILINEHTQRVDYLSQTYSGKTHDKKIADTEAIQYPAHATLDKDTGFQGYEPSGVLTLQPRKKPKGKELGIADSFFNRLISSTHPSRTRDCQRETLPNCERRFSPYEGRHVGFGDACGLCFAQLADQFPSSNSTPATAGW